MPQIHNANSWIPATSLLARQLDREDVNGGWLDREDVNGGWLDLEDVNGGWR